MYLNYWTCCKWAASYFAARVADAHHGSIFTCYIPLLSDTDRKPNGQGRGAARKSHGNYMGDGSVPEW